MTHPRRELFLRIGILLLPALMACAPTAIKPTPSPTAKPEAARIHLSDAEFWSNPEKLRQIEVDLANRGIPTRSVLAPTYFNRNEERILPLYIVQAGPFDEFRLGNFADDGYVALVDVDRNTLQVDRIFKSDDEPAEPAPKGPPVPTGSPYSLMTSAVDLAKLFLPTYYETTGRFVAQGLLPLTATATTSIRVGGDPATFDRDLSKSLAQIPERTVFPTALLHESRLWTSLRFSSSSPEGLRATVIRDSGREFLDVEFALPELRGERLRLPPGTALPSGILPPDAAKWIHVLAAGVEYFEPAKVLLPAMGTAKDRLLRGRAKIDLQRLFPGWDMSDLQSIYVYSGAASLGPLVRPVGR